MCLLAVAFPTANGWGLYVGVQMVNAGNHIKDVDGKNFKYSFFLDLEIHFLLLPT